MARHAPKTNVLFIFNDGHSDYGVVDEPFQTFIMVRTGNSHVIMILGELDGQPIYHQTEKFNTPESRRAFLLEQAKQRKHERILG